MRRRVLVIDDDPSLRQFLGNMLQRDGYEVELAASGQEGIAAMDRDPAGVVFTDLQMEGLDGMAVLGEVRRRWPDAQVVMITAHATAENAVEAMKRGAYDYVVKPFHVQKLRALLEKAFERQAIERENDTLRAALKTRHGYGTMIGSSEPMQRLFDLMERVKDTPVTVLISGESGTGKELVARALHYESARASRPFRSINCGAIPENLIEAELFGYKRGAFTGAVRDSVGLFASAEGGTLFLDEVGEMPSSTQVKVLRAIQERRIKPVGGVEELPVDVRLVAASNRDLATEVKEGRFREDLFYRLRVVHLDLPPLRERRADLPALIDHFLRHYGREFHKPDVRLASAARDALLRWAWPGNVRELENALQRGVALALGDVVDEDCLPLEIGRGPAISRAAPLPASAPPAVGPEGIDLEASLGAFERELLESALEQAGGVKKEAARLLGVTFRSFRYRLAKAGLDQGGDADE